MVRVAFCGISHETNTFATAALGLTGFVTPTTGGFRPARGDQVRPATGQRAPLPLANRSLASVEPTLAAGRGRNRISARL